jgi:NAD(P)-dependent dehydrogenase (short-subunit alcohol dehydrogenase family)
MDRTGVALVTGGSRGIGAETCRELARRNWDVAINFLSRSAAADALVEEIRALGRRSIAVPADVGSPVDVDRMVRTVAEELGPIDLLVNNAGIGAPAATVDQRLEDWNRVLAVDLTGPFLCIQAVLPGMLERRRGAIVNVSSQAGLTGGVSGPAYAAAKGGLVNLTRCLARELVPSGIAVSCIAPTMTETELLFGLDEGARARLLATNPLGRFLAPQEVARVIVGSLAAESGLLLSGECIRVGWS